MTANKRLLRSWMFVPGDRQRMTDKALGLSVDALMMDIEDGVAPAEKDNARRQIAATMDAIAPRLATDPNVRIPALYARVNGVGSEWLRQDLESIVRPGLDGLVVPKVDHPEQVATVEDMLNRLEPARKVPAGSIKLLVAIESPIAVLNAYRVATASARVMGLTFGAEDYCRKMGMPLRREGEAIDLIYARSAIANAAAAANVQSVDGVWTDLKDPEGLRRFALQARRLGMSGMSVIHPSQIDHVNAAFTPTMEDIQYARDVLQAFDEAHARGEGVIAFRGQMLDFPVVDRARQTVSLAKTLGVIS